MGFFAWSFWMCMGFRFCRSPSALHALACRRWGPTSRGVGEGIAVVKSVIKNRRMPVPSAILRVQLPIRLQELPVLISKRRFPIAAGLFALRIMLNPMAASDSGPENGWFRLPTRSRLILH